MTDQAAQSISLALQQGLVRHQIDLLLPINEKESNFTNTEPLDYPCSLQKEFDVACALTTALLQRLNSQNPKEKIVARRLDDGGVEGEPCSVLYPETSKSMAAVIYPTADRLKQIKDLAKVEDRPLLLVNPQWREEGQVISDFGIGPWKSAALSFLSTFNPTYYLKERRIGAPGTINTQSGTRFVTGGVIRVLKKYPGDYECYACAADGSNQMLDSVEQEPTYQQLDAMIKRGRERKLEIFDIAKKATYVFSSSTEDNGAGDGIDDVAGDALGGGGPLSDADIDAMDAASLRRMLTKFGEPTSGKMSKLKERLKEVVAKSKTS